MIDDSRHRSAGKHPSPFTHDDVWVLRSVISSQGLLGRGATLKDVIGAADCINHAIINYKELNEGLWRLINAGCIRKVRGRFRPRPEVRRQYRSLSNLPDTMKDKRLLAFLNAKVPHSGARIPLPVITSDDYWAAVNKYTE